MVENKITQNCNWLTFWKALFFLPGKSNTAEQRSAVWINLRLPWLSYAGLRNQDIAIRMRLFGHFQQTQLFVNL